MTGGPLSTDPTVVVFVSEFLLHNDAPQAEGRFAALARTYDPASARALAATGVGPGWRCWEVGGGGGTITEWMAERVGSTGTVLVTDIDSRWMPDLSGRANVTPLHHDVVFDDLPDGDFDLIHARLVLLHLPQRHLVLDRLISCLRPGGWLVVEDFDCEWTPVLAAPSRADRTVFETVHDAFVELLREKGADPAWGRALYSALGDHGLREVSASTFAVSWPGGGTGVDLHRVNIEQLAGRLTTAKLSEESLDRFRALLDDPAFAVQSYPLVSAAGQRAADVPAEES